MSETRRSEAMALVELAQRYVKAADASVWETNHVDRDYEPALIALQDAMKRASTVPPEFTPVPGGVPGDVRTTTIATIEVDVERPDYLAIATAILDDHKEKPITPGELAQEMREAYEAGGDSAYEQEKLATALFDMLALIEELSRPLNVHLDLGEKSRDRVTEARAALMPHLDVKPADYFSRRGGGE